MLTISGIYQIKNKLNGKVYIGSTARGFEARFREHRNNLKGNENKPNAHLQNAWNKYGADSFVFETLDVVDGEELVPIEQAYLDFFDPEYNISKVAGSSFGVKRKPKTKKWREEHSKKMTGRKHSLETKEKMSRSRLARASDCEVPSGVNHYMYGKKHSEETKRKISEALRTGRYAKKNS